MAENSKIEWTDATWNPIRGCSVVSSGCKNCYAMQVAARFSGAGQAYEDLAYRNESGAHWTGKVAFVDKHLEDPLRWKRPRRIFVNSMSDLFHPEVKFDWLNRIFDVMERASQHTFQILTKRPDLMRCYVGDRFDERKVVAPNIWFGVSVEDQRSADERIPDLINTPAAVRWLSCEPLLEAVDLSEYFDCSNVLENWPFGKVYAPSGEPFNGKLIHWVVVGGESGHGARPMHPDWARSLRDQCVAANVPFFFKQHGEWLHESQTDESLWAKFANNTRDNCVRHVKNGGYSYRVGKKAAGRLLDGREWDEMPERMV